MALCYVFTFNSIKMRPGLILEPKIVIMAHSKN